MLDFFKGKRPEVIHVSLLQTTLSRQGHSLDAVQGNVWDVGTDSIPRGKANYWLKAPSFCGTHLR